MPPRRSSRSTRASLEPVSTETLPAKRKRGSTAEPAAEEKENVAKPPSTRRSASVRTSAPPSKARASRSKTSLPKVVESDGEDEDEEDEVQAPAKKKARPSAEAHEEADSDAETARPTRTRRSNRPSVKMEADEDESAALRQPAKRASSKRGKAAPHKVAVEAVEEEEEEDVKPHVRGRRSKKMAVKDSAEDESDAVSSKGSTGRTQGRRSKARVSIEEPPKEEDDDDDDVEVMQIPKSQKPPPPSQPEPSQPAPEEEEEAFSLMDPIPMPAPETLAQAAPEQPTGPVSRLVIHKIALVNFKSYAGRQEIGPFHKSFSAIVGPNGSGKSNTIDALLFVFGYRASKMRQAKVSELIHNSANFPDLQECSVEVHFREIIDMPGPDAFKIVPNSQLVVARHAYKNNQSVYSINEQSSTYTQVRDLLKGRGIDLDHKRFLILQGEVESIAQMKPKAPTEHEDGLLEYLEDIIGTSTYKQVIDEAFKELEYYSEERTKALNKLKFVEREKSNLENDKKEAENYLRMKNELVRAQSRYWQWIIFMCFETEKKLVKEENRLRNELAAEKKKHNGDVEHLNSLKTHYEEREAIYQEIKEAADAARKDLTGKEKQEVSLSEQVKHADNKAKKLKKQIAQDNGLRRQAERDLEDNEAKIKKNLKKVKEFEVTLGQEEKALEAIRDSLKDKTQTFHDQIEVKQKDLQPWTTKINTKKTALEIAQGERDALAQKADAIRQSEKEAEEHLSTKHGEQEAKAAEQEEIRQRKASLQQDLRNAEKRNQDAQNRLREWRTKASSARQKIEEAKASQSENRSQGKVLDSLQRLKSRGQIQGFHGRLGSLGTIDEKYDVAISTACGQLHHLVVDTVEQAQQCIEYLRTQNIGRATFMVLEKIPEERGMGRMQTPENVPRLFDLVKPREARFAPAFYKALRDTLVASDLDQANRIAFGATRHRVVTLAGQMFETSGTMSGGGGQPQRGAMSSKFAAEAVRPEVMRQYEQDSEDASAKLAQATQDAQQAEAELERLRRLGPDLEMSFQKLGLEIETGKRAIAEAEKRLKHLKTQNKPNQAEQRRISQLDVEIQATTEELEQLHAKSSKIEQAIKDLEQRILEIGGSKLLAQKSKVEGVKLHIKLANEEITKAEVAMSKAEKDATKYADVIEKNGESLEEAVQEAEKIQDELTEVQGYLEKLRAKCAEAELSAENSKEDLDKLKEELDEKEEEIKEFLMKQQQLERKISDNQKELENNGGLIEHWQSQHDQLALEEVDDEEDDDEEEEGGEGALKGDADASAEGTEQDGAEIKPDPDAPSKKPAQKLHEYSPDELRPLEKKDLVADVELLDEKVKRMNPDLTVLKEYKRREAEFDNRAKELERVTGLRDEKKAKYDGYRKRRLDEFMSGFTQISSKLKEMYQMITLGGNAELELVDSLDPFSEGIIFSVMPPKKSWKNISNLSGGEKTLSSLALVFALHHFKPTPLYFMDEIDAALDFRNVSIVANYIKDRTKNAQFIIISLRNDMFELSSRLIGIYKTNNTTKSVCISNRDRQEMERKLRLEAQRQQQQLRTPQRKQFSSPLKQSQTQTPIQSQTPIPGLSTASQM